MLKIKDNVDLKELEKYGFEYSESKNMNLWSKTINYYPLGDNTPCCRYYLDINAENRHIYNSIFGLTYQGKTDHHNIEFLDDLYDLIQDGLVEKVKE